MNAVFLLALLAWPAWATGGKPPSGVRFKAAAAPDRDDSRRERNAVRRARRRLKRARLAGDERAVRNEEAALLEAKRRLNERRTGLRAKLEGDEGQARYLKLKDAIRRDLSAVDRARREHRKALRSGDIALAAREQRRLDAAKRRLKLGRMRLRRTVREVGIVREEGRRHAHP